jgi:hypothetical protein
MVSGEFGSHREMPENALRNTLERAEVMKGFA